MSKHDKTMAFIGADVPKDLKNKAVASANNPNAGYGKMRPRQKLDSWLVSVIEAAVEYDNLAEFAIGSSDSGQPVLKGAGFEIELNTDIREAEELVSFLNIALNKSDSDRIKSRS